jgi:hypothetical protein
MFESAERTKSQQKGVGADLEWLLVLRLKLVPFVDETDARRAVARVGPTSGQRRRPQRNCTILRHAIDSANSAEKALIPD